MSSPDESERMRALEEIERIKAEALQLMSRGYSAEQEAELQRRFDAAMAQVSPGWRDRLAPIEVPEELSEVGEEILATKRSTILIDPFETEEQLEPWVSKYLGTPYLPKGRSLPTDDNGDPLAFLAQLNFAEIPALAGYPSSGLVQFFIAGNDFYGLEFTEPYDPIEQFRLQQRQQRFRVLYYPEVDRDAQSAQITPPDEELMLPVNSPCKLAFSLAEEVVPITDYLFERLLGERLFERCGGEPDELFDLYNETFSSDGNKIGGYASFSQEDIREIAPAGEEWLLLLQIDEAEHAEIMWGDAGVGNFFIERRDLERRDFSRVLFNWDCS